MDLVIFQPGNPEIYADTSSSAVQIGDMIDQIADGDLPSGLTELISCHYGMQQQMTNDVSNSARTSGRPAVTDITCVKYCDMNSLALYQHCLIGQPLDDGTPTHPTRLHWLRNSGGNDDANHAYVNFMTIEIYNTMVSSIEGQSHPNDMATEQFTLNFTEIRWRSPRPSQNAAISNPPAVGWSKARNRPF